MSEFGAMQSSLGRDNRSRAREIKKLDQDFGGIFRIISSAPQFLQREMISDFTRIREEFQNATDKEEYLKIVRNRAAIYGAVINSVDPKASPAQQIEAFTQSIGSIAGAMEALSSLNKKAPKESQNH